MKVLWCFTFPNLERCYSGPMDSYSDDKCLRLSLFQAETMCARIQWEICDRRRARDSQAEYTAHHSIPRCKDSGTSRQCFPGARFPDPCAFSFALIPPVRKCLWSIDLDRRSTTIRESSG